MSPERRSEAAPFIIIKLISAVSTAFQAVCTTGGVYQSPLVLPSELERELLDVRIFSTISLRVEESEAILCPISEVEISLLRMQRLF